jgi:hypothetical protein
MYNVAFRYTAKTGAHRGVCTWTTFESKEEFDNWYTDEHREREEVIAKGVSNETCIELTRQTPLSSRLRVALHNSTNSETGETNEFIFGLEIEKLKMLGVI